MYVDKEECSLLTPSHSHRTRGYLCSFPITGTPLSREKDNFIHPLSRLAITKNTPFPDFLGNLPETIRPKIPPFPRKWECACALSCIRVGGGGGDVVATRTCKMHVFNSRITSTLKNYIISLTSLQRVDPFTKPQVTAHFFFFRQ